tara:strand:+ start:324 stop:644 length:321 start_codon:yes stop_codon:yes gene_type:complete
MLIKSAGVARGQIMFKTTSVLFLFFLTLFFAFNILAEEKLVVKEEVQFLYLIRYEDSNGQSKKYDVIINGVDWFRQGKIDGVHVVVDMKKSQDFVKPLFVKRTKNK